jgi:hypothetical protein
MCNIPSHRQGGLLTGRCDHCEWQALTTSYSEMVKTYQDHLRADHPGVWLRG